MLPDSTCHMGPRIGTGQRFNVFVNLLLRRKQTSLAILVDLAGPKDPCRRPSSRREDCSFVTRKCHPDCTESLRFRQPDKSTTSTMNFQLTCHLFPKDIKSGQTVLIDDGNISLEVHTQESDRLVCIVLSWGNGDF